MIYQEKIFTEEECKKIINYSNLENNKPKFNFEYVASVKYENDRIEFPNLASYNVYNVENTSNTEWMFDRILLWFEEKSGIKLNPKMKHTGCTLHKYVQGDKFSKHIDLRKGFEDRRYNLGIQLNDDYEGGEYICWDDNNNEIIISKETGNALFYHCRIEHEIKEIKKGERWSIVMPIINLEIIENKKFL